MRWSIDEDVTAYNLKTFSVLLGGSLSIYMLYLPSEEELKLEFEKERKLMSLTQIVSSNLYI